MVSFDALSSSKSRRMRAAATKQRLYSALQPEQTMMNVQSQLAILTSTVDSLCYYVAAFISECGSAQAADSPNSIEPSPPTEATPQNSATASVRPFSEECEPKEFFEELEASMQREGFAERAAELVGSWYPLEVSACPAMVAELLGAGHEDIDSDRPEGASEAPKVGNIFMRSIISKVVGELASSPQWRDLPENIKVETVNKLKEPYSGNSKALYSETDVQELMERTGSTCGRACAQMSRAR